MPSRGKRRIWKRQVQSSKELTDEQLVKRARNRAKTLPLSVDDLFDALGYFNNIFWLSILLNAMIWSIGGLHYATATQMTTDIQKFKFSDSNKIGYQTRGDLETFENAKDMVSSIKRILQVSQIFGPLYILLRHNAGLGRIMLESCLLYCMFSLLLLAEYNPLIRMGAVLTALIIKPLRYVSLMHLTSSIPPRLLPLALGIMGASDSLIGAIYDVTTRFLPSWKFNQVVLGLLVGISGVLFRLFAPSPIMLDLAQRQGRKVEETVAKALPKKADSIDIDALIDDTIFAGRVTVSPWKKALTLLKIRCFRQKYIWLMLLTTISSVDQGSASSVFSDVLLMGSAEKELVKKVIQGCASLLGIAFLHKFNRRFTIAFHILVILATVAVLMTIRLENYDICALKSVPNFGGKATAAIAGILLTYSSRVIKLVTRLVFMQHIPVEQQMILFIFGSLLINASTEIFAAFLAQSWTTWEDPYRVHTITIIVIVLFAPTILLLDNCSSMPIISSDYEAYHLKRSRWKEYPELADEPEPGTTYETTTDPSS